jgi:hypothetical protein
MKLSTNAFCCGLPGVMWCQARPVRLVHARTAREISSGPLSLTVVVGIPRRATSASSSRATRVPEIEVSTTAARDSRVKSSTTTRIRKRRAAARQSEAKSTDQR